ncbi:ATP-binding protein [Micromonospora aurantiaca (nom. illeg.)]|uniref:ATP-binding protein n=1 Tax=Micromonospora aurantiaca (nom. illeg.) TaxID=47850 RepID=UPI0037B6DD8E
MTRSAGAFFTELQHQENPLSALTAFLDRERAFEQTQQVDRMRFVGYVLEIGYDGATIITSDPFKRAVGGIPRGSFLILSPSELDDLPPHFTLLRVMETAPTPLSQQVQQTYFELHKKSMPELDVWTQSELQWGALRCSVLGMFYPSVENRSQIAFAGDVNNVVSAHRYMVYAPDEELLDIIINGMVGVRTKTPFELGRLRPTECLLSDLISGSRGHQLEPTPVNICIDDLAGARTAMFGKTRLGKSNVVKLLAQSILDGNYTTKTVGQLIFDINGEYANDNEWDGKGKANSLRNAYADRCDVYALTQRDSTESKPLKLNFFEQPDSCIQILSSLLAQDGKTSNYIRSFASVELMPLEEIAKLAEFERTRPVRKIQMYWAILHAAGFSSDEGRMRKLGLTSANARNFDPGFSEDLRKAAYAHSNKSVPSSNPQSLDQLTYELLIVSKFAREAPSDPALVSKGKSGKQVFDPDDRALLDFLNPTSGSGPSILSTYRQYHAPDAGHFVVEIIKSLGAGKTVILDLGNASDQIRVYFSNLLSVAVFREQERKFTNDELGDTYVQLYFEEAHNLFPVDNKDFTGIYARFAKEGAKFHIGMVYSTQSPSTINRELLTQTENFFVGHLSSENEVKALSRLQRAFSGVEEEIMRSRTPGYMRMLTQSHRFVIPVQAKKFAV